MNRGLALVLLAVGLVVISFMLGIFLDRITSSKRKKYRKQGVKFADNRVLQARALEAITALQAKTLK